MSDDAQLQTEPTLLAVPSTLRSSTESQFVEALNEFMSSQQSLIELANYLAEQRAEMENVEQIALNKIQRQHPDATAGQVKSFMKVSARFSDFANFENLTEEEAAAISDEISAVVKQLPPDHSPTSFFDSLARAERQAPRMTVLYSSLLTMLVGDFEVLIAAVAKVFYSMHPERMNESGKSFTWKEISGYDSLDQLRDETLNARIYALMRDSYDDWIKFVNDTMQVSLTSFADRDEVREVFQRRHLIIHNGGLVSKQYQERLPKLAPMPPIGAKLTIDSEYFHRAADLLCVVAHSICIGAARKHATTPERLQDVEGVFANVLYRLLQEERFFVARESAICQMNKPIKKAAAALIIQVNRWIAEKHLDPEGKWRNEVQRWDTGPLGNQFRLAQHALLDDLESGLKLARRMRATDELALDFWLTWPLLKSLREYEKQKASEVPAVSIVDNRVPPTGVDVDAVLTQEETAQEVISSDPPRSGGDPS